MKKAYLMIDEIYRDKDFNEVHADEFLDMKEDTYIKFIDQDKFNAYNSRISLSDIKEIKELVDDWKEVIGNIKESESDFEVDGYRFIRKEDIDQIMIDELSSDTYTLGCFNSSFIAGITGLGQDMIDRAQKADNFELLGELMLLKIDAVQEEYSALYGYGNHFASYDHNENEILDYYAFRVN